MKSNNLWITAAITTSLLALGYFSYKEYTHAARKKRLDNYIAAERADATEFAGCVGNQLSAAGLESLAMHQYKPAGLAWQSQMKISKELGLDPSPPPTGKDLFEFTRKGDGMDWKFFNELIAKCKPLYGPPFEDVWRHIFWKALEATPRFQQTISKIRNENDSLLKFEHRRVLGERTTSTQEEDNFQKKQKETFFRDERSITQD